MKKQPQIPLATHQHIINNGLDVPLQRPAFAIALTEVGIANKTLWPTLPQGRIPFTATINVALPAQARGIHMSRMEQAISALHDISFDQPSAYAEELLNEVVRRQGANTGQLTMAGKLPIQRTSLVSEQPSMDALDVQCRVMLQDNLLTSLLAVGVCHITACPCTQVYNQDLFPGATSNCPMPTHSQRSHTMLTIQRHDSDPGWQEILACLEESLHVTQDLLKRPDEAEIVLKSHQEPQFAEDAVRATAQQVARKFGQNLPATSQVIINSLSLESIHIHDVTCRLQTTLGEIDL